VVEPEAVRVANGGSYGGAANRKAESWWVISGFDGVEPEVSDGSQAPMNGLGKERGQWKGSNLREKLAAPRVLIARDFSEM
jgi:hypothetical protein